MPRYDTPNHKAAYRSAEAKRREQTTERKLARMSKYGALGAKR